MMMIVTAGTAVRAADTGQSGSANTTDNVKVRLYTDDGVTDYQTGSEITVYTGVQISGNKTVLPNTTMKVTVPKQYLDPSYNGSQGSKASTGANLLKDPVVTSDANHYYITYAFKTLSGGQSIDLPFVFQTMKFTTPPNTTIPIKTQFFDEKGTELGSQALTLKNLAQTKVNVEGKEKTFTDSHASGGQKTSTDPANLDVMYTGLNINVSGREGPLGIYAPAKYKIVIQLKNGVIFDPSFNSANAGWTYDQTAQTLTKTVDAPQDEYYQDGNVYNQDETVYLKYPGWTYDQKTAAFTTTVTPLDANGKVIAGTVSGAVPSYITIKKKTVLKQADIWKGRPDSYTYSVQNKDKVSSWRIVATNTSEYSDGTEDLPEGTGNLYATSIVDRDLDGHLYYDSITIDKDSTVGNPDQLSRNILYGYNSKGEKTEIARNLKLGEAYTIPEANHKDANQVYRKLELVFPDKVTVEPGKEIVVTVKTKVFPHDWEQEMEDTPSWFLKDTKNDLIGSHQNWVSLYGTFDKSETGKWLRNDHDNLYIYSNGRVDLDSQTKNANCIINETAAVTSTVWVRGQATTGADGSSYLLKNSKLYMIVPNGWEYVNEDSNKTQLQYTNTAGKTSTADVSPEILYDFQGTGQMALAFDIPNDLKPETNLNATIHLKATTSTPTGSSQVISWLSYENNGKDGLTASICAAEDKYDLNGNGQTKDKINQTSVSIKYTPPKEVAGVKLVGKDLNSLTPASTSYRDLGDRFWYGLKLVNQMDDQKVKTLDLLDVLPYVGDKALVKNQQGVYIDRGSKFKTQITGPVKFIVDGQEKDPEACGYEVLYSTDKPVNGDLNANLGKTFSKNVSDWSKVTMFRIVMKDGTVISPKSTVTFAVPAKVNDDQTAKATAKHGDVAYNSFAFASSVEDKAKFTEDNYLEALKTVLPLSRYTVDGTVYRDYNYDASLSKAEQTLKGITVGLFNNSGQKVDETQTDANGYYKFAVDKRGTYIVRVLKKPSDLYFHGTVKDTDGLFPQSTISTDPKLVNNKKVGNDVNGSGISGVFALNPTKRQQTVNSALEEKPIAISVQKEWSGTANDITSVKVSLTGLNQQKTLTLEKDQRWRGSFTGLRYKGPDGKVIPYTLTETTKVKGFETAITGNAKSGFTVRNISTAKVDIPVVKKWDGPAADKAVFNLLADGKATGKTLTLTKDNNWKGLFSGLSKYDKKDGHEIQYTVEEQQMDHYTSRITGNEKDGYVVTNKYTRKEVPGQPGRKDNNPPAQNNVKQNNSQKRSSIQTGDQTNPAPWIALGALAALGIVVLSVRKDRKA